jgi:hypothetical protein
MVGGQGPRGENAWEMAYQTQGTEAASIGETAQQIQALPTGILLGFRE